jgi:phosphoglycolate phosphatase
MSLTPPPDAVIFDFDGVILDSLPAVEVAINGALQAHGFPSHSAEELARFIGPPTPTAFIEMTGAAPDSATVAACVATYHEIYERVYLERTRLVDGIADVLARLTLPRALATAKERRFVAPLLERFCLEFPIVCAPELAEPKAETVARARDALGARHAVMIGDRHYDVEAARANSLRTIGVTWGIGDREELSEAEAIVARPEELLALLS